MAGLLDYLNGDPTGGLMDYLPRSLTGGVADPNQWQNPNQGGAPDWFAAMKSRLDNGQGIIPIPGRFPQMRNPPGVPNTAMPGPQDSGDPGLPPNAQPAMQPPQQAPQQPGMPQQPQVPPQFQNGPPMIQGGMGERALGALGGFANARGFLPAMTNAITTLATGRVTDPHELERAQKDQSRNVTYQALLSKGVPDIEARAAMGSPDVLKQLLRQHFSPKETGFHIVGYDQDGKAKYGWVGKQPGEITPYHVPGSQGDATFQDPNDPNVSQLAQGLTGNDYVEALAKVSPGRAALLKKIGSGEIPFPSGRYLQSQAGMQLMEDLARFEPGSDATHFASRFGTRKDFTSGKSAQNLTSFNTVISHLDTLHNTIDGLQNSASPMYNKAANWLATNTGDTKYQENFKKFDTARQAVTAELTRAFRGTGGNVADIKDWNAKLDAADSPQSLKAAVNSAIELLKGRIDAVGDQYNRGMKSSKEPLELLSPKAQEAIKRLEATTTSGTSAAPAVPKRVRQNGHVYEQQPDGSYKPVQ